MIVDAQVHVWRPTTPERPWTDRQLASVHRYGSLEPDELLAAMSKAGVDRAVLVPPAFSDDGNDYALGAARERSDRFAVVAGVPLDPAAGRSLLESWRDVEGLLGVRVTFSRERRSSLLDGTADWFWPAAEEAGVPVMVYAPGATPHLGAIARRQSSLRLTIDHFGLEGRVREADLQQAADELVRLADLPMVSVKASALPVFVDDGYPFRSLHDAVRTVVGGFGAERVFWGSDLSRLSTTYREGVTFLSEVDGLSGEDLEWIMGRGILQWLSWPTSA